MKPTFDPFTGNITLNSIVEDPLVVNNLTVNELATISHIHGNIAGNLYVHAKNQSGVIIPKATPVYIIGSVGDTTVLEIAAADAANASKRPAIGITESQLAVNQTGNVVMFGEITGVATGSYNVNNELYLASGGGLTNIRPTSGYVQSLAVVGRAHATTGSILVWTASGASI